ncbi:hypothetical protein RDI58_005586 [Solanum bulbocastanum]|uniref:Uncharacterized protein n=1 Tax=Solanum bulbocastanum TaxID=147425 RepID=A0AAN8U3H7_SOLBU
MRSPIFAKLCDGMVHIMLESLTSGLRKSDALHPKLKQSFVKYGQRCHGKPVGEELAIQTAANLLMLHAARGVVCFQLVFIARVIYVDRQTLLEYEQYSKEYIEQVDQFSEEKEHEINRLRRKLKVLKQVEDKMSKAAIRARAKATESEP